MHGLCAGYGRARLIDMESAQSENANAQGPCISIDTACSSSLVALTYAASALRHDSCGAALAAGVNLPMIAETTAIFAAAGMLAADGRCKVLDASADGYGRAEACVLLSLRCVILACCHGLRHGCHSCTGRALECQTWCAVTPSTCLCVRLATGFCWTASTCRPRVIWGQSRVQRSWAQP